MLCWKPCDNAFIIPANKSDVRNRNYAILINIYSLYLVVSKSCRSLVMSPGKGHINNCYVPIPIHITNQVHRHILPNVVGSHGECQSGKDHSMRRDYLRDPVCGKPHHFPAGFHQDRKPQKAHCPLSYQQSDALYCRGRNYLWNHSYLDI